MSINHTYFIRLKICGLLMKNVINKLNHIFDNFHDLKENDIESFEAQVQILAMFAIECLVKAKEQPNVDVSFINIEFTGDQNYKFLPEKEREIVQLILTALKQLRHLTEKVTKKQCQRNANNPKLLPYIAAIVNCCQGIIGIVFAIQDVIRSLHNCKTKQVTESEIVEEQYNLDQETDFKIIL